MAANWWLDGATIQASDVIIAWAAKGASSLANSYINLANPGTYNLNAGNDPSFDWTIGHTFDGSTDYLQIGSGSGPIIAPPFTIALRITPDNTGVVKYILGGTGSASLKLSHIAANQFRLYKGTSSNSETTIGTSTTAVTTNKCMIITYDGSGNFAFYLNGVADGSGTNAQTITTDTDGFGTRNGGGSFLNGFDGVFVAMAIYNRVLNSTEIASINTNLLGL